ncbi:MAG: methyltransferase domain-containing protein [Candidatus Aminicenantes bacterium]|nr:methyltransferase domain-containing protein [Candidatus Aminicenantes bacterium]
MRSSDSEYTLCPLAPAHLAVLGTAAATAALLAFRPRFAFLPAALFVLFFLPAALFLPRLRLFLPVISRGRRSRPLAALTFDDGPDPETTPLLLNFLEERSIRAAFFVTGEKAEKHPGLVRDILARGHEIGNHSFSHNVFLMLRRRKTLEGEIVRCQKVLAVHGVRPLAFRPPVGVTSFGLFGALLRTGLYCVGFSRKPADYGNRRLAGLSRRALRGLKAGDVILLHDASPGPGFDTERWLGEMEAVILGLENRGLKAALLSEVLQRPVMEPLPPGVDSSPDPVRVFYDALAERYDREQDLAFFSPVRRAEEERFTAGIGRFLRPAHSVLEIGAGTGRFTLPLAGRCRRVLAVDPSPRMLRLLESKAREKGLGNIETFSGRVGDLPIREPFDVVCSFSSFEYITDLPGLFRKIRPFLKDGGVLYFITARRSFFRFFAQVGNALRQGVWLHARGRRRTAALLERAGFSPVVLASFGSKSFIRSGALLEAAAIKKEKTP